HLPIQAVVKRQVGIESCAVGAEVPVSQVEGVLHVVQVANVEVAVHGIEILREQRDVLHLGTADALQADRTLAGYAGLPADAEQGASSRGPQHAAVEFEDRPGYVTAEPQEQSGKGKSPLFQGSPCPKDVEEERIGAEARKDAGTVHMTAALVVDRDGN